jgi:hypothetical protein
MGAIGVESQHSTSGFSFLPVHRSLLFKMSGRDLLIVECAKRSLASLRVKVPQDGNDENHGSVNYESN